MTDSIVETLENQDTGNQLNLTGSQIEVINISDSETSDSEINDSEFNTNFQIKSEIIGKQFISGFDNSGLPVYRDLQLSTNYSTKEMQMIETDESEDEFEDLSKLTDLSKLYKKLILKVNVETKWSSEKMYDKIKRKLPIDDQEKTFLNGEVGNDKITNRQSITGKSLSEALIPGPTNPQYDRRLFLELQVQYMKIPSSNLGRNCCVQKLFFVLTFRTMCAQHVLPMF